MVGIMRTAAIGVPGSSGCRGSRGRCRWAGSGPAARWLRSGRVPLASAWRCRRERCAPQRSEASARRDRQERWLHSGLERGSEPGREKCDSNRTSEMRDCHARVLRCSAVMRCDRRRLSDCSADIGDGVLGAGGLDAVGLSWTSWDMIEKVRRADQGFRGIMDAGRTERGFHAMGNGGSAVQRLFRWVGMNVL